MRPHDVCRWLGRVPHDARQIDRGSGVDVHVRPTHDGRDRLHDGQVHQDADGRRGRHLALVRAGVALLGIAHLQRPVLHLRVVDALEALVVGERGPTHRQQVDVAVPYP